MDDRGAGETTDEVDWQAIYAEQLPRVFNFFRYRLRIEDDATVQDLTATTFEKAWRARKQYQPDLAAFNTWLFTIARNTANDYFRQHRDHVSLDEAAHFAASELVEERVEQNLDAEALRRLLRSALPSFGLSVVLMAFVAALFPPVRVGLAQFIARATPISSNPTQSTNQANVIVLTLQQAHASLPVTLTRIPSLAPNGFVMSSTLMVYRMLTGTSNSIAETRADYFWQSNAGESLVLSVQAETTAQPITQTTHAQPVRVNGHEAAMADLLHRKDWTSLTWRDGGMHYSLLAPRSILSSTLIKMAESVSTN